MNTLLLQRQHLRDCEAAYKHAQSMLDNNSGNALIQAKQSLKEARYAYAQACIEYVEEVLCCSLDDGNEIVYTKEQWCVA